MARFTFATSATTFSLTSYGNYIGEWPKTPAVDPFHQVVITGQSCEVILSEPGYRFTIQSTDEIVKDGLKLIGTFEENIAVLTDSILTISESTGPSYQVYTAYLNQSGTDAPVAVVHENTLPGALVWSRASTGTYRATAAGVFPDSQKVWMISPSSFAGQHYTLYVVNENTVELYKERVSDGVQADSFFNLPIEIRVYP
jgi:hypothetical protein